jgi:C-terminal processing protease CtpA/Prc
MPVQARVPVAGPATNPTDPEASKHSQSDELSKKPADRPRSPDPDEADATVGIMVWPGDTGELMITEFMPDTSACSCGLKIGDILTAVDGEGIRELAPDEASLRLSGRSDSIVRVQVQRGHGGRMSAARSSVQ